MVLPTSFKISSFLPPGIFHIGDKYYACPGWHEVPENTTLDEVMERWTQEIPKIEDKPAYKIEEEVSSSKGDKTYMVTFDGPNWSCSCVGFGFRRNCSHIKKISQKYKNS